MFSDISNKIDIVFLSKDLGIDLGTANTVVCARGEGIIISEPSVVAVYTGTNRVYVNGQGESIGEVARRMEDQTPPPISVIRPPAAPLSRPCVSSQAGPGRGLAFPWRAGSPTSCSTAQSATGSSGARAASGTGIRITKHPNLQLAGLVPIDAA